MSGDVGKPVAESSRLQSAIKRIGDDVERILRVLLIGLMAVMTSIVFYEVVARYVFNAPTRWSEEMARYLLIWLALSGLGLAIRKKQHIRVDFLLNYLPEWLNVLAAIFRAVSVLLYAVVLLVAGYEFAVMNKTQLSPAMGVPMYYVYLAVPVGATLIIFYLIEFCSKGSYEPF
ncbi:MAG: TRAP transporter small permease [Limnochordia bacterium]|jgi:TRAP-type C4-dicarboxylate transport system permease small subunit